MRARLSSDVGEAVKPGTIIKVSGSSRGDYGLVFLRTKNGATECLTEPLDVWDRVVLAAYWTLYQMKRPIRWARRQWRRMR